MKAMLITNLLLAVFFVGCSSGKPSHRLPASKAEAWFYQCKHLKLTKNEKQVNQQQIQYQHQQIQQFNQQIQHVRSNNQSDTRETTIKLYEQYIQERQNDIAKLHARTHRYVWKYVSDNLEVKTDGFCTKSSYLSEECGHTVDTAGHELYCDDSAVGKIVVTQ
ncbi:MAG TPA: hypothetical protein VNJ01_16340 [Bacteriovoracaceae bacterium]|nr:hypothetical protein [Bacteriovoracaceae bacterium]